MSTEFFAFVQAQVNTQAQQAQQVINPQGVEASEIQPGLFDSLITEFTEAQIDTEAFMQEQFVTPEFAQQSMTLGNQNSFAMSAFNLWAEINTNEAQEAPEQLFAQQPSPENLSTDLKNLFATIKSSFDDNPIEHTEIFGGEKLEEVNEVISQILNDDDLAAKIDELPEDIKQEIQSLIQEIADILNNDEEEIDIKQPTLQLITTLTEHKVIDTNPKTVNVDSESEIVVNGDNDENDEEEIDIKPKDSDDEREITSTDVNISIVGATVMPVNAPEINTQDSSQPQQTQIPDKPSQVIVNDDVVRQAPQNPQRPIKNPQREIKNDSQVSVSESQNESEDVKQESNFRNLFEARRENRGQSDASDRQNFDDSQQDNENQNFDQTREFFSRDRNSSRSRTNNNDRRVTAANNDSSRTTSTTSHRTESRNDFSSFFEGVLNNRRNVSQTSPSPLNLRANVNFTQSETLRDGLVNVVRFIRADGVQKANVVIDPPALGRISVELTSGTSGVEATIKVASEQIRQLIQDQLSQLRMNLSQQGVQVAEFTVDVQQDNQQGGQNSQDENQNQRRTGIIGGVEDEEPEEFRVDLEDGLLYWVA